MNHTFLEQFHRYKSSQSLALVCGDTSLTYAELHERCLALASRLHSLGIGMGSTSPEQYDIYNPKTARCCPWVAVVTDRSVNAVIGVIAAWMAGGAYVLMEENAPDAYIQGVIEDTAAVIIRGGELHGGEVNSHFMYTFPQENEIACAVFTSGSTGRPKGAVLEHRVINEMLRWQTGYMRPGEWTATAAYAPLGFIAALWEIFFPLANGLTLHMLDESTRHDLFALESYIENNNISYLFLPPNIAEVFTGMYKGGALKYLRVAGGRLGACGDPKGYEIMYHLGMAENGGSVTFKPIKIAMSGDIPIGKAWHTTKVRLDNGEMIVSGPSLFRGYLARKDETQGKLVQSEYQSGDLARIDIGGELVHMGRNDWDIKIRDMKVNPAQVESALGACAGVTECCVTAQDNTLIGWIAGNADEASLRTELSSHLPEYMIPSVFVKLEKLPLSINGKIDRSALRYSPWESRKANPCDMSEREQKTAGIFERLLGLPAHSVRAEDSFLRLGGDSLRFMRLQAEIAREFSQNIPYTELFENPTPRMIAAILQHCVSVANKPIPPAEPMEAYPLSAPMRQMWLLWRTGQDRGKYTVSIKCRFTGEIDKHRLIAAFKELTRRNAILRSRFTERGGDVFQDIQDWVDVSLCERPRHEFNLTETPIFDIALNENILCFTTHHIIADATGLRVLIEDFWTLYGGGLPQKSASAADITMWALDKDTSRDENYWLQMFAGKEAMPRLACDFAPPDRLTSALRKAVFFNEIESAQLHEYAVLHNATLFQLFLAAYALLLSKLTSGGVVIGVPFSGREHPDTDRTIGMLVRTLPVRLDISGMNLDSALKFTRERFMSAWAHQGISLERLTEIMDYPRTASRNAFYDVMINFVPLPRPLPNVDKLHPEILCGEYPGALFDLVLDLREETDGLSAVFTYAGERFKTETICRLTDAFKKLLLTHELEITPALAPQIGMASDTGTVFDETPQISELLRIWKDVLGTEDVLPGDDFFAVGGTSLTAIRIEAALFEKGWLLSASDIFQNPILHEMAEFVTPLEDIDWEEET